MGDTDCDVAVTGPMPWSMDTEVAPVTVHCKVADCPGVIVLGFALNPVISGKVIAAMVITAVLVTEPSPLVAVRV